MKFSLIVPVYNVEDYILKCLESINEQTYKNYEVIIVDDGSKDSSSTMIKKFIKGKENFKYYKKENGGLSDARNYGLKYITGDYLLFLDSDDYISKELLVNLFKEIKEYHPDIIKYGLTFIRKDNNSLLQKTNFHNLDVNDAIKKLLEDEFFESAWLYCYKASFWKSHKFQYTIGKIHEDFGLTPLVIMNAKKISSIDYAGYNYVIRENSIMTSNDEEKILKKFNDCLYFYGQNIPIINKCKNINEYSRKMLKSFYANGMINRLKTLNKDDFNRQLKLLKEYKVFDNLMADTLGRKAKKICYKIFPKWFIKNKKDGKNA